MSKQPLFIDELAKNPDLLNQMKGQVAQKISEIIDIMRLKEVVPEAHIEETPERVAKMYIDELFHGCYTNPPDMKIFKDDYTTPVLSTNIQIKSTCSHHGVPFYGRASIYYVPNEITGLSKFYRVSDYFSRRPQIQERLNRQICDYIWDKLKPHLVIVAIKCKHMCICQRGVNADNPYTTTYYVRSEPEYAPDNQLIWKIVDTIDEGMI